MKKKIKWGLVLCSVLIPVCLSACKQGTVEKQGSSNKEVQKKAIGDEKPITCRPADLLEPELSKIEAEMSQWKEQDEDILTYALFPQVATEFFKYREAQQTGVDVTAANTENKTYPV